jgi:hypothetical protein
LSPRLALRFILLSIVLAGLLMAIAIVLNVRLRALQQAVPASSLPPTPSLVQQLASMAIKLDANGLGSQVISGTQISIKLSPYPVRAGQVTEMSIVAMSPFGQLATITPTLFLSPNSPKVGAAKAFTMTHEASGAYLVQGNLFPIPGEWQGRIGFYLNARETSSVILFVSAQ